MAEMIDEIVDIAFFPLKSGHAATVSGDIPDRLEVGPTGFQASGIRDREFILYDPQEGSIVTQRGWGAHGQKVRFPQDRILATVECDVRPDHLNITVPSFGSLAVASAIREGRNTEIEVFGNALAVTSEGKEPSKFFSTLLGRPVELFRADRETPRLLPARYRSPGASNQLAGADGMPFLLGNQASLDWQHDKNGMPRGTVSMRNYRPNIVMGGLALGPFVEDFAELFRIGSLNAEVACACPRCVESNVHQDSGEYEGQALRVLRGRRGRRIDGSIGVQFCVNLNHEYDADTSPKTVGKGDPIAVLSVAAEPHVDLAAV
jgi:uncharacterized protein YcbX